MRQWTEVDELCRMIAKHDGDVAFEMVVDDDGDVDRVTLILNSEEDGPEVWVFPVTMPVSEQVVGDHIRNGVQYLMRKANAAASLVTAQTDNRPA